MEAREITLIILAVGTALFIGGIFFLDKIEAIITGQQPIISQGTTKTEQKNEEKFFTIKRGKTVIPSLSFASKSKIIDNPLYSRPFPDIPADVEKREAVKEAFLHAWNNYKKYCWGMDQLDAKSRTCHNNLNAGLTIIDSLSTLYIMNLTEDFKKATKFVEKDFKPHGSWSIFEFIIRFVGGFISAYELSGNELFLEKAKMSADAIIPLIDPETGFYGDGFSLSTDDKGVIHASGRRGVASLADIGSYQLEFLTLSKHTGDKKYAEYASKVYKTLWSRNPDRALLTNNGFNSGDTTHLNIGAGGDSYYEYIIKIYVMLRGKIPKFLKRHIMMMDEIKKRILFKSHPNNLTVIGEATGRKHNTMMEHLATFAGGMIAVGTVKDNPKATEDLQIAAELAETYYKEYHSMKSGIGPERMVFNTDKNNNKDFSPSNEEWMMRPESVESVQVAWKFTGLPKFRDYAWDMFKAINKTSRVANGFAHVYGVNSDNPSTGSIQESFFLAETMKYLYLMFDSSRVISPSEWVFNTEAHPIRIWSEEDATKWAKIIDV